MLIMHTFSNRLAGKKLAQAVSFYSGKANSPEDNFHKIVKFDLAGGSFSYLRGEEIAQRWKIFY